MARFRLVPRLRECWHNACVIYADVARYRGRVHIRKFLWYFPSSGVCFLVFFLWPTLLYCEENNSWQFTAETSVYILSDETFLNPVISADKNHLHLEARYFDEEHHTGSVFAGYNFRTGDTLQIQFTPILGGVFGRLNGIAPGFLLEMTYRKLSFTGEFEYLHSTDEAGSDYFYGWSELVYSPADWIWFGAAGQRTRLYKADLEVQRGILLGFGKGDLGVTGYLMDPGGEEFGRITIVYQF